MWCSWFGGKHPVRLLLITMTLSACSTQVGFEGLSKSSDLPTTGEAEYNGSYMNQGDLAVRVVQDFEVGQNHSCTLTTNGQVICIGENTLGQLGNGTVNTPTLHTPVVDRNGDCLEGVVQLSSRDNTTCAVTQDGGVYCWGENNEDQAGILNNPPTQNFPSVTYANPILVNLNGSDVPLKSVEKVSVGTQHVCALTNSDAYCWGSNSFSQLGQPIALNRNHIAHSIGSAGVDIQEVYDLAVGDFHSCLLYKNSQQEKRVSCWGMNTFSQLGRSPSSDELPADVTSLPGIPLTVSAGSFNTYVLVEKQGEQELYCFGSNSQALCGRDVTTASSDVPHHISIFKNSLGVEVALSEISRIDSGFVSTCVLGKEFGRDEKLYCWGRTATVANPEYLPLPGEADCNSSGCLSTPTEFVVETDSFSETLVVSVRHQTGCIYGKLGEDDEEYRLYCWGEDHSGELNNIGSASDPGNLIPVGTGFIGEAQGSNSNNPFI